MNSNISPITKSKQKTLPLTSAQKQIICEHLNKFDKDIVKLDGMEGTTVRQVADYRKKINRPSQSAHRQLADALHNYISEYGLPSKYGAVIDYEKYLRERG